MSEIKDIMRIRKYEQNGEEKTAFDNVGILIMKPDGKVSIKLNAIPVDWDGWLIAVDKRAKGEGQGSQGAGPAPEEVSEIEPF
jgi:hypothetical protein